MSLTVTEAKMVNRLLRYFLDIRDNTGINAGLESSDAQRADSARAAAELLADHAAKTLQAGLRAADVAEAWMLLDLPTADGGAFLTLVSPEDLPCACPDEYRDAGVDVPYCPQHHWPDMAGWIAGAGWVLVDPSRLDASGDVAS